MATDTTNVDVLAPSFMILDLGNMDPELLRNLALVSNGEKKVSTSSTSGNEIAVIARVSDPDAWEEMTEIRTPIQIGQNAPGEMIVTGRIPIRRIEFVRSRPFVLSLKAARKIRPVLTHTVPDIEAGSALPDSLETRGGKGCIVGIVDFGCDFAHQNFMIANKTRILLLWHQGSRNRTEDTAYGAVYTSQQIDAALQTTNPYNTLGYQPDWEAHGTHVMDIASGNGAGTGAPGVAPDANIIFVEVDSSDIPWQGADAVGKSFGDSVHLLEALRFIFNRAGEVPCVINVSLGTNGGPHDGTTLVEQGIDSMLKEKPGRAVVIAASNSYADNIHTAGNIPVGETRELGWKLSLNDRIDNEMEIWYEGKGRLTVEMFDANGNSVGEVKPGESGTDKDRNGEISVFISNRLDDPNNHDNVIGIYLKGGTGKWKVLLKNTGTVQVSYNAWIERNDSGQSSFDPPYEEMITLGSISCGQESIVVGSYDAHRRTRPISFFSSSGPTRDGRSKPEVSAPGHEVIAANARSGNGVITMSGTSMAAPAVSGAIACYLAEATARGLSRTTSDIRKDLKTGSRSVLPNSSSWDRRYGWGRISVKDMIAALPNGNLSETRAGKKSASTKSSGAKKESNSVDRTKKTIGVSTSKSANKKSGSKKQKKSTSNSVPEVSKKGSGARSKSIKRQTIKKVNRNKSLKSKKGK